jgi:hypothetical protein
MQQNAAGKQSETAGKANAAKFVDMMQQNSKAQQLAGKMAKKPKLTDGANYFDTIANNLFSIQKDLRANYTDSELGSIEVEVRFACLSSLVSYLT